MYQSIPKPLIPPPRGQSPPGAIPRHLTHVKVGTVGNLTHNEARPVGYLTFVSKRLSAVQMWWDNLQQNALNRARGKSDSAKKKARELKKNYIMSV